VLLIGGAGGVLLAGALVVSLMFGRWVTGLLGGMTGDTYGAVNEVVEVTVLLFAIILFDVAAELFQSPLA
jgi:adenosylcobinamide-GDP ribazoletransferase